MKNRLKGSLAIVVGWCFLAPSLALAFSAADVPPALDCSGVSDYVDKNIKVKDPHTDQELPLSKANEDAICRYSFKTVFDQDQRQKSNCWNLFYKLRQQVGESGAGSRPGTLRHLMMESCRSTHKFNDCRLKPNGTEMQACVSAVAKEVTEAQKREAEQAKRVTALAKEFQDNLNKSMLRFNNLKAVLAKVTNPDDQKKDKITVDGITVNAAHFGQRDIASVIVLVGGTASTPPRGTVAKSALPRENQAAFEFSRHAVGASEEVQIKAMQRAAEYQRIAQKTALNANRASSLTGLNKRNDPTLPGPDPARGAIQPPRAASTPDPFPSNSALANAANAANAAGALGKAGGGGSGSAGGQTSSLASQGYPAARQEELVQAKSEKSETAKPANELGREKAADQEMLRELTATDDKKIPEATEADKVSKTGQEMPAANSLGGGRGGVRQVMGPGAGETMAAAAVKASGGGVNASGGTGSGSRTGEMKDCKGADCAKKEGKDGSSSEGATAGGGVPGFEGGSEKAEDKGKEQAQKTAAAGKEAAPETPTKFEEVKDKSKDFAALDAIFNEVAGKAEAVKKAGAGMMTALAEAVGLKDPSEESAAVKPEGAEEPKDPEAPAPKKAERRIASGTEVYTDNFDGDLGLDMSLFQRVSECYRRRGLARSAQ